MNFESKRVNYVNETMLGKFEKLLDEGPDWQDFYKMAKDTSGKTLKEFENKYGSVMDKPHVKDALNTKDFKSFMKIIKKFEN